jgi:methylisocitrate lyase
MARTDAIATEGLNAAVDRCAVYIEAGADMIFAEAVTELSMYRKFKETLGVPILANLTRIRTHPLYAKDELTSAGEDIVLYCCSAYRAMNAAALTVYETIRAEGTQRNAVSMMQTRTELYEFLGYHEYEVKLDRLFAKSKQS